MLFQIRENLLFQDWIHILCQPDAVLRLLFIFFLAQQIFFLHAASEIIQHILQGQVDAYFEALPEATEEERAYMTQKFNGIKDRITEIDAKINEVAKGWKTGRMGKAELAILRLAVYEMLYDEEVPVKVAINEAVELAKTFGGDDSAAFVNGILAKLVKTNA